MSATNESTHAQSALTAEKRWNRAQSEAIEYPGRGLLLSAGAGSGKTATLTERVARLVCSEEAAVPVSRMLIVTFTVAAAKELKDRIGKRIAAELEKKPSSTFLIKQAVELENARISTISSFFLHAVRPYAARLSLPPDFRVAEDAVIDVIKKRIMNEVVDDFFDSDSGDFVALADALSASRDENSLAEVLLGFADELASKGADADAVGKWADELEKTGSGDFFGTPHGGVIRSHTAELCRHYHGMFASLRGMLAEEPETEKAYGVCCDSLICDTASLADSAEREPFAVLREMLTEYRSPSLGRLKSENKTPVSEFFASAKNEFSKELKNLCEKVYRCDVGTVSASCAQSARICRTLAAVLGEYYTRFESEKKEKGFVDFGDLETYARRIFCNGDGTPSEAAENFSKQYDYIFIDEYQDVNETQDAVFSALSHGMKRFMVGDIKQSIYSFRGAAPSVFTSYREKWKPYDEIKAKRGVSEDTEATVFMSENFRSDKNVIDFVNLVSGYMFPGSNTPFEEGDRLVFSKPVPEADLQKLQITQKPPGRCEICLLLGGEEGEDTENKKSAPRECDYVAERIAKMIKSSRRGDGTPFVPGDFAVLLRGAARADDFAAALAERGVAVKDRATDEFFEQPEILLTLCLLNAIDNPLRDIYLAGAMKSPVFGFTVDDMLKIRLGRTDRPLWYCVEEYISEGTDAALAEKCAVFADFTAEFRSRARRTDAASLLSALYERLSLMSLRESENDSEQTRERIRRNLTALYEHARQYEKNSFTGLYGFIEYLGELMESKLETERSSAGENAVTITTIHKSKGLEFPVCFLCESTKKFSDKDIRPSLLTEPTVGMAMKLQDESGLVRCSTPLRFAVAERIRSLSVCEEMRVLYVAMTRASEQLIISAEETATGANRDLRARFEKARLEWRFATPFSKMHADNYMSWILPAAARSLEEGGEPCFDIKYVNVSQSGFTELSPGEKKDAAAPSEDLRGLFRDRFSFKYPYKYLENIPAKLTVSKLKPDVLDGDEELGSIESYAEKIEKRHEKYGEITRFSNEYDSESREKTKGFAAPLPAFLSENETADYAFVGTATHIFLQFCNFEKLLSDGFEAELKRLLEKEFISKKSAQSIDRRQIDAFAKSALLREVMGSPFVKREFRFNVALPAADFTSNGVLSQELKEKGCEIIVQGVCDLVYENGAGELVLIDYKTDRLTDYELRNRRAAEEKLRFRHRSQLLYYKTAIEKIFARKVAKTAIYSLPLGDTVDVL